MNRGLLVLLAVLGIGIGAAMVTRLVLRESPSAWLCREYGVPTGQTSKIERLQQEYASRCGPFCGEMCRANDRLESLAMESSCITPDLRRSLEEADAIRMKSRLAMLEHFYAVAAEMPADRRRDYLRKVLPLVIDSCGSRR
jgi:hypothetical protein